MEWLIVHNNRAPHKQVFEYLSVSELKEITPKRKAMLHDICDSIEFIQAESLSEACNKLINGDWLFEISGERITFSQKK